MTALTLEQHIAQINNGNDGSVFALQSAASWREQGINTPPELDHYLASEAYINMFKEENGIKPRWIDFSLLTTDQINAMIDDLHDSAVYMHELDKSDRDEWIRNEQIESELQPTRYDLMAYNHGY